MTSEVRPDPEALLRRVERDEANARRGRLKVFFGAAPGVGKTYAMLEAARAQREAGVDVVIGWVETHRRAETAALAEGFERLPPREVEHRGVRLLEFDIDQALARRPGLLLLDELAHTNAPGSRHPKRWQDARELVEAGIDVWTTLNVQHLESVNDLVERITGVVIRETLPDQLLDEADEVEIVDLPPEDLLRRLADGKVYVPEQAARAVDRFFRKGNLTALRELALRRTAEHVDAAVQDYRRDHAIEATWPVTDRILVCIRPNPESGRLVRAARRLATRLRAPWIAAWVESPGAAAALRQRAHAPGGRLRARRAARGRDRERLGRDRGRGGAAPRARAQRQPDRGRQAGARGLAEPAARLAGGCDREAERRAGRVHRVGRGRREPAGGRAHAPLAAPRLRSRRAAWCWPRACCRGRCSAASTSSTWRWCTCSAIVFVATRYGRGPSLVAVVLSVAAFDFFFIPPHLTFAVSDTQYLVSFAVMLVVGLLVSTLGARVRDAAEFARQRERRTQSLYALVRELAGPRDPREIAAVGARHVSELLHSEAVVLLPGTGAGLEPLGETVPAFARDPRELAVAQWALDHRQAAGAETDTLPAGSVLYEPLVTGGEAAWRARHPARRRAARRWRRTSAS